MTSPGSPARRGPSPFGGSFEARATILPGALLSAVIFPDPNRAWDSVGGDTGWRPLQKPSFSESTSENHVSFRGQHLRDTPREERAIASACVCGNLGSVPHGLDPDNPPPPPCSGCDAYQTTLGRCPCELGTALRGPSGHPDFHRKEERSEMIRRRPHGGGLGLGWDLVPRLSYEGFTASISPATGSVGCGRGGGMPVSAFRFPQTGCASHPVSVHRWREPRLDSKKLTALQCLPETPAGGAGRLASTARVPSHQEACR